MKIYSEIFKKDYRAKIAPFHYIVCSVLTTGVKFRKQQVG